MRLAAGVLLVIAGGIWILQGLDIAFAPKSFMTGNPWWVLWGAVAVALGAVLIGRRRRE
ncbi:MAG: LPXTG cell wall anchor domain-containing protein [Acidimicrobiia bacterium]